MLDDGDDGTRVPDAGHRDLEHGSVSARNLNLGPGQQYNHNQAGTGNTQYNAHTQMLHVTAAPFTPQEKIEACQDALLAIRPEDHRAALIDLKGERVKGTCEWIKDDDEYLSLLRGHTRLLWIRGGPGKGKTMLSIFLTKHLEKTQDVVYFFCRADDDKHRSSAFILRSLLWQLSKQRSEISEQLLPHLYPPEQHEDTLSSREALWRILMTVSNGTNLGSVICVIDGLDECDEDTQRWLATKIVNLCEVTVSEQAPSSMKFILVSRPKNSALEGCRFINFDPDNDKHISRDIEAFVSTRVQTLLDSLSGLSEKSREEFRARMTREILERAEGTFLWVGFAMTELLKKGTRTQMEAAIRELPMGLPALYDRMLLQIDPRHRLICSKILRWVAFAARPMSVIELGLIINDDSSKSVPAQHLVLDHLTICGSFIAITDNMVSLVHESARDYLSLSYDHNTTILKDFRMQASEAHSEIATACLDHIAREYGRDISINETGSHVRHYLTRAEEAQSFLDYATSHWPEHMRQSSGEYQRSITVSSSFFAKTTVMRNKWWAGFCERQSPLHRRLFHFRDVPTLHLASYLGITPWVAQLLRPKMGLLSGQRSNRQTGPSGYRPLMHATLGGHVEVVRLLLRSGAHIDAKDAKGRTALHHAVTSGQVAVTQLLLEHGASVDIEDVKGETILHIAAESGNLTITQQVFGYSKNVDARCKHPRSLMSGSTALHYASRNGHVDVMQFLLDNGAEVNAINSAQETPLLLYLGPGSRDPSAARLLLQLGASTSARDRDGDTSLIEAAHFSSEAVVRTLLRAKAEIDVPTNAGESPLHKAARHPDKAIMSALIQAGGNFDAVCRLRKTPLHIAASYSNVPVSRALLQAGAEVDSRNIYGETPLHAAALSTYSKGAMLEVLLQAGAAINAFSSSDETPLHAAARCLQPHVGILNVLLRAGANPNARSTCGETPLHFAARNSLSNPELLSVLLHAGALSTIRSHEGKTPLHVAAENPHSTKVFLRVLLQNGAQVDTISLQGKRPLDLAFDVQNASAVCILVNHGAQINSVNEEKLWHWAAAAEDDRLVKLFIGHCFIKCGTFEVSSVLRKFGAKVQNSKTSLQVTLAKNIGSDALAGLFHCLKQVRLVCEPRSMEHIRTIHLDETIVHIQACRVMT